MFDLCRSFWLLFSLLAFVESSALNNPKDACASLSLSLADHVSFPREMVYEESVSSYAFNETQLRPTCLVTPTSPEDVAIVVQILSSFSLVAFAIRSGGHNTNKGFANIDDGITIDLSAMNKLQINHAVNTVSVGAGARWQSVYDALDPYSLSVQGGRNGHVGVGGYLLGGGIGFFSPERGWSCDSVVNFEIVLSSGIIANANATSNANLFVALKGGLNNFGIVTRFDLEIFEQGPMWGGVIIYPNSSDEALLDTLTAVKNPEQFDPHAIFTFGFLYDTVTRQFTADIAMYHSRPEKVNGSSLESFANIQPQLLNTMRIGSPGGFASETFGPVVQKHSMHWASITFHVSRSTLSRMHTLFQQTSLALTELYGPSNLTIACSIQSVPPAASVTNPNSLGYQSSTQPEKTLFNMGIAFQYDGAAATEGLGVAIMSFTRELEQIAQEDHVYDEHIYSNYAGSWQNVFGGYGIPSLKNMLRVARTYDRRQMFQRQVKGGFKLLR